MQAFQSICDPFCFPYGLLTQVGKAEFPLSFSCIMYCIIDGFARESLTSCHLKSVTSDLRFQAEPASCDCAGKSLLGKSMYPFLSKCFLTVSRCLSFTVGPRLSFCALAAGQTKLWRAAYPDTCIPLSMGAVYIELGAIHNSVLSLPVLWPASHDSAVHNKSKATSVGALGLV